MKQKEIFLYLCFLGFNFFGVAQQMPQYSQWASHQFALNPAHAGIKKCVDVQTLYRNQWIGIIGAPQSGFVTASIPLSSKRRKYLSARHGMGVKFEKDQIGQIGLNRFNLAYSGHFNFSKVNRLSLGIYGGMAQIGFDPSKSITVTPDPAALQDASVVVPDAHFGAWWNGLNYYAGLTVNQLIPSRWPMGNTSRQRVQAMLNIGCRLTLNDKLTLRPAAMLKVPFVGPLSVDLNLNLDIKNQFNVGVGFRNQDALIFLAGFKINEQFSLNYSFDYTVSGLRNASSNTHEISIGFITCKPDKKGYANCALFE
jgi:type IX secretion system PorP/SprF family membrane protein